MKVVVTGATGVLGRYLLPELVADGHEVLALSRAAQDGTQPGVTWAVSDLSAGSLAELLPGAGAVVHLAGIRGGAGSMAQFAPNVDMAAEVVTAAGECGVRRVVLASSISVYSALNEQPWREDQHPVPMNAYGVSKLAMEVTAQRLGAAAGVSVCSLRLGHLYGALEDNAYMVNTFFRQAFAGQSLTVTPPSDRRREMVYAADAARACALAVAATREGPVNVGGAGPLSNHEIATAIAQGFGTGSEVLVGEGLVDRTAPTCLDGNLAAQALDYHPQWTMPRAAADVHTRMQEVQQ